MRLPRRLTVLLSAAAVASLGLPALAQDLAVTDPVVTDPVAQQFAAADGPAVFVATTRGPGGRPVFKTFTARSASEAVRRARVARRAGAASVALSGAIPLADRVVPPAQQWALSRLSADRLASDGSGVVVAVIDSGVDAKHPAFAAGSVLPGWEFSGNGTTDQPGGTDDWLGHGTHVAGIVAGRNAAVRGLAPGAKILPVAVSGLDGLVHEADLARAVVWAADRAQVLNLSLGGENDHPALREAIGYAERKGVLVVAAGGNEGQFGNRPAFPAAYPSVLAVAAANPADKAAPFSTRSAYIDVTAPGEAIRSAVPTTPAAMTGSPRAPYADLDGTSMAAPYAAAAAAAVWSARPGMSAAQVRDLLETTAQDLGPAGRDDAFGHGMIDPVGALAGQPTPLPVRLAAPTGVELVYHGAGLSLRWKTPAAPAARYDVLLHGAPVDPRRSVIGSSSATIPVWDHPGQKTALEVAAVDANGLRGPSATVWVDFPVVPMDGVERLVAFPTGTGQLQMRWHGIDDPRVWAYGVWIDVDDPDNEMPHLIVPVAARDFQDGTFTVEMDMTVWPDLYADGKQRTFYVRPFGGGVFGGSASARAATYARFSPKAPLPVLTASGAAGGVLLHWRGAPAGTKGYRLYRDNALHRTFPASRTSFFDTGMARGDGHEYTVAAFSSPTDETARSWERNASAYAAAALPRPSVLAARTGPGTNAKTRTVSIRFDTSAPGATGWRVYRDGVLVRTVMAGPTSVVFSATVPVGSVAGYEIAGFVSPADEGPRSHWREIRAS